MPRLMSVAMTKDQVYDRSKTVTRRVGWAFAKVGDVYTLCEKVQGRQGAPLVRIVDVEVVSTRWESLRRLSLEDAEDTEYALAEVAAEGFPGVDPREFVRLYFTEAQGLDPHAEVNRIEWRYLG